MRSIIVRVLIRQQKFVCIRAPEVTIPMPSVKALSGPLRSPQVIAPFLTEDLSRIRPYAVYAASEYNRPAP